MLIILNLGGYIIYNKRKIFEKEINYIIDENIKEFIKQVVDILPDYFYEVPASSSGKYHPPYALGDGGLVRHTKAAAAIAHDLMSLESNTFSPTDKDLVIAAIIPHDGCKSGKEKQQYTVADHPLQVISLIKEYPNVVALLGDQAEKYFSLIASHMGEWNTDYKTKKEILPKPTTDLQIFVHIADYLASRKYLNYDFEDTYYNPANFIVAGVETDIEEIISLCRKLIADGKDKEVLYNIIASYNNGKKNPNSISDNIVAEKILKELKGV